VYTAHLAVSHQPQNAPESNILGLGSNINLKMKNVDPWLDLSTFPFPILTFTGSYRCPVNNNHTLYQNHLDPANCG
jgi:hypothetical protein